MSQWWDSGSVGGSGHRMLGGQGPGGPGFSQTRDRGRVVSCGRCRIFPREQSSFQPGDEYPVELF